MVKQKIILYLLTVAVLPLFQSCGIYSFTGASLSPDIKTFSIDNFRNVADQVIPSLAEDLTESLKDKFIREMGLSYVAGDGDISFEGTITGYKVGPSSIGGNETATTSRLTMTLKVHFENTSDPKSNFDATFNNYIDFDSQQELSSIQDDLHKELIDFFVQDIFNRSVNNW